MANLPAVAAIRLWAPASNDPAEVLCRGMVRSGSLWTRFSVRKGPSGLTVSYPNRRGKALAWPDDADRHGVDRTIIAEARRLGWVR